MNDAGQAEEPDPFKERSIQDGPGAVPIRFLSKLLEVLNHEWNQRKLGNPYNRRLRLERGAPGQEAGLRLTLRRDLPLQALANSLLILSDASLSLDEAQRLFPERRWLELKPTLKIPAAAKIIQLPERNYGKIHLSKPEERRKALDLIGEVVEKHRHQKIGLITHQSFASLARQRFPDLKIGHYYGQRGSNEYTDCEVLIAFGTPNPNPNDLERQAEALYWDQSVLNNQTILEPKVFRQAGETSLQTRVRSYADPRLREMLHGKRDEELIQAVYRARPLSLEPQQSTQLQLDFGDDDTAGSHRHSVTIYIFSSIPLNGLEVSLETTPAAATPTTEQKVVDLNEAAQRLWRQNQRLTDQRLATAAHAQRSSVLRWKRNLPAYQIESSPPPATAPPTTFADVSPELIAAMF